MNRAVSKTVVGATPLPRVRIPPPPLVGRKAPWDLAFRACERWRGLYRAALAQATAQDRIIRDASRPLADKQQALIREPGKDLP